MFVTTLLCQPGQAAITPTLAQSLCNAWGGRDLTWLAPREAVEFECLQSPDTIWQVWQELQAQRIDLVVQPSAGRRKKMLLADMDSTIVTTETLDDLAAHVGLKEQIAAITARAMNGELDFEAALRERVGMLAGLPVEALESAWQAVEMSKGAETLIRTMAANGTTCILVSGGFKYFTSRVAARCGFHEDLSNDLIIADGKLTGGVTDPILDKHTKLQTLTARAASLGLALDETMAIGDGANDLPMLGAAGLGVAYRGKPAVRAEAPARLDHADLRGLLYAQGYRTDAFWRG